MTRSASGSTRTTNADVYAKVTAKIVASLEAGVLPWQKPWIGMRAPCNAVTGNRYSGMNVWALALEADDRGYTSAGWMTFKQAIGAGVVVRKGEKGTPVFYMNTYDRKPSAAEREAGQSDSSKTFFARLYHVFNLDQLADLDGAEGSLAALRAKVDGRPDMVAFSPVDEAEAIVTASGATIRTGSVAAYLPTEDVVMMPATSRFVNGAAGYYPVLFHELAHWTGAANRLGRNLVNRFGDEGYALEELVAELTAAFLSHKTGLDHASQSPAYLDFWLSAIKNNPAAFQTAASQAQRAADFLSPEGAGEASAEIAEAA